MKKILTLVFAVIILTLTLTACNRNSDSIDGTWVPKDAAQTVGFTEITFNGDTVTFAGVPSTPGARYVQKVDGSTMTISIRVTGAPEMPFLTFTYSRDGDSMFLNDIEYVRK